jgi:CII-binding regulator of phage lambda lysogenization HflD
MAKISAIIPEPTEEYEITNQRQLREGLDTLKNELNFSFQEDLKQELQRFTWFNTRFGC